MKFTKSSFLGILLLLLLAACTGTTEPLNPTLLVTGYQDATGAKVALVRDNLLISLDRLAFLPASVRPLLAPAVGYDVVDRERARSSLVVLSRSTGTGSATSYLTTFSLTGIDPANPAAFVQQGDVRTIDTGTFTVVPIALQDQALVFCPTKLQVTQGGNYAAVLNVPSLCGLVQLPFIDILDLRGLRLLERISGVSSSGLYLSQNPAQDLLYYATPEAGSLRLRRATMPRPGQPFGPNDTLEKVSVIAVRIPAGQSDAVDLQRAGTDTEERLVFLFQNSLINVTEFGGTGEVDDPTETLRDNALVLRNDQRSTEATFILSTPRAGVFTYVPSPAESDNLDQESARVVATLDAVVEPTRNLIYFVSGGFVANGVSVPPAVAIFDLSAYDAGERLPDPTRLPVLELTGPSFITWAQSVP